MYRFLICDDEVNYTEKLKSLISVYCNLIHCSITVYNNGKLILCDLDDDIIFDIYFLDIEMQNMNGITLARKIREHSKDAIIIFISAYEHYAIEAFELSVFRYIPKQLIDKKLESALRDALNLLNIQNDMFYIVTKPTLIQKIPYREILYICKEGKNSIIVTSHKNIKIRKTLTQVFSELSEDDFIFIERGFIVNILNISKVENNLVTLKDNTVLGISQSHLKETKETISNYWRRQL